MKLIPQELHQKMEGGVDWGCEGRILARRGLARLVWRSGSSYWSGLSGTKYSPSSLTVIGQNDHVRRDLGRQLHEGGRLSHKMIARYATEIDGVFGEGAAAKISTVMTLVVDP